MWTKNPPTTLSCHFHFHFKNFQARIAPGCCLKHLGGKESIEQGGGLAGYTPAIPPVNRYVYNKLRYSGRSAQAQYSGSFHGDFSLNLYCTRPSTAPCFHIPLKESPLDSIMVPWPSFRPSFQ
mmetsp:Transcript_1935/g.2659  ORF Transcript_1935/g.2659 Transcript_1935/m.2659 type:complete len:123 (-) Transcript_1935:991-1359(-)